jgi:hypothetical protein
MVGMIFSVLLIGSVTYALISGAAPERIVAAMLIVAALLTSIVAHDAPVQGETRWGVFMIDSVLLVGLFTVAARAYRLWPLPICSLQLLTVVAHVVNAIGPSTRPWPYVASIVLTGMLIPPILAYGTFLHRRRLMRNGADQSWRSSLSRLQAGTPAR